MAEDKVETAVEQPRNTNLTIAFSNPSGGFMENTILQNRAGRFSFKDLTEMNDNDFMKFYQEYMKEWRSGYASGFDNMILLDIIVNQILLARESNKLKLINQKIGDALTAFLEQYHALDDLIKEFTKPRYAK